MPFSLDGIKKNFQSDAKAWSQRSGRPVAEYKSLSKDQQKSFQQERFRQAGEPAREKRQEQVRQRQIRLRTETLRAQGNPETVRQSQSGLKEFFGRKLDVITSAQSSREDFRFTLASLFSVRQKDLFTPRPDQNVPAPDEIDDTAQNLADTIRIDEPVAPRIELPHQYSPDLDNLVPAEFNPETRTQLGEYLEGVYNSLAGDSGRAQYGALTITQTPYGFALSKPYQPPAVAEINPAYANGFQLTLRTDRGSQDPARERQYLQDAYTKIAGALELERSQFPTIDPELLSISAPESGENTDQTSPTTESTPEDLASALIQTTPVGGTQESLRPRYTEDQAQEILARREAAKRRDVPLTESTRTLQQTVRAEPLAVLDQLEAFQTKTTTILDRLRGLDRDLERIAPDSERAQELQTEYADLTAEAQYYAERTAEVETTGREAHARAQDNFDKLNTLQSSLAGLSAEEEFSTQTELLPALATLGYTVTRHPATGRYLVVGEPTGRADALGADITLNNFDTTVINYENRDTRRPQEVQQLFEGDIAILEDVATGTLQGLPKPQQFALLKRLARVAESLKNNTPDIDPGRRVSVEQQAMIRERARQTYQDQVDRLVAPLTAYGFSVQDRAEDNPLAGASRRYQVDFDFAQFQAIAAAGGLESYQAAEESARQAEAVDTLPSLETIATAREASALSPESLTPDVLDAMQRRLDTVAEPFVTSAGAPEYLILGDTGFTPVNTLDYADSPGPKLTLSRTGFTNKDAAQIVANTLNTLPRTDNPDGYQYEVVPSQNGQFRIDLAPTQVPRVYPTLDFAETLDLSEESETSPDITDPGDELEIIPQAPRSQTTEQTSPEPPSLEIPLAVAENFTRPVTSEDLAEIQDPLDNYVSEYTTPETQYKSIPVALTDSADPVVLRVPTTNLTSKLAAGIVEHALNTLVPEPRTSEYYIAENTPGRFSLELKSVAPTRPDSDPAEADPFDEEFSAENDAERDYTFDADNPFAES